MVTIADKQSAVEELPLFDAAMDQATPGLSRKASETVLCSNKWELPVAKRKDPLSSYTTGEAVHRSGRAATQRQQVLDALRQHPGSTSAELAQLMGLPDRYGPNRRLPELFQIGLVQRIGFRKCKVTKRMCQLWQAIPLTQSEERK